MKQLLMKLAVMTTGFRPFTGRARGIWEIVKELAPYAAIELILPGGTLLAILCWLYRRRHAAAQSMDGPSRHRIIPALSWHG